MAVQSFENLYIVAAMLLGKGKKRTQPIFPYNKRENSPTSFANNFVFVGQMTANSVHRHVLWPYRPYQNLGQIDYNLHNYVFDDEYTNYSATKATQTQTQDTCQTSSTSAVLVR